MNENILDWDVEKTVKFFEAQEFYFPEVIKNLINKERIDGKTLLLLSEKDLEELKTKYGIILGDIKKITLIVHNFQSINRNCLIYLGLIDNKANNVINSLVNQSALQNYDANNIVTEKNRQQFTFGRISPSDSEQSSETKLSIQPEFFKTVVSLGEWKKAKKSIHAT